MIFLIAGIRGYYTASESSSTDPEEATDLSDISAEAQALKAAYQRATAQLETLGTNITSVAYTHVSLPTNA